MKCIHDIRSVFAGFNLCGLCRRRGANGQAGGGGDDDDDDDASDRGEDCGYRTQSSRQKQYFFCIPIQG